MNGYEYDVFISYRRSRLPRRWVDETFYPLFEDLLREALGGREPRIFKDVEEIHGGDNWHSRVCRALATSKCLVPILLPSYFSSEWCVREFSIIYQRQKELGFNTIQQPNGLIVPLKIHDGDSFPEDINKISIFDCNEYFVVGKGLELTVKFVELQTKLNKWVDQVADAVKSAPDWNPDWLTEERLKHFNRNFYKGEVEVMQAPSL